jgi:AcrR family transcriptional regulator
MGIVERKEREREARRSAILDAAEFVFKLKGFTYATMDEIAKKAELAKGTIYLYYKSKEELQIGLVMRGLDLMSEEFRTAAARVETAFEKLLTMGDAYWHFANTYPFYFATMHVMDVPKSEEEISEEPLRELQNKTNGVWDSMISLIEQAKIEGKVLPEVNPLAFAMLLWMDTTSTLRFGHKIQSNPNPSWSNDTVCNPSDMDFKALYDLNAGLILHQIVTDEGRKQLAPLVWPQTLKNSRSSENEPDDDRRSRRAKSLDPFAEEILISGEPVHTTL